VVQKDTREVGPVAPVDLRAEIVHTLHHSEPTHRLGGLLKFIPTVTGMTTIGVSIGTTRTGGRTVGLGKNGATGSVQGVQERLLGTRTRFPCRHEFDGLLFDQISKQTLGGT
jgi:hypothetical protein